MFSQICSYSKPLWRNQDYINGKTVKCKKLRTTVVCVARRRPQQEFNRWKPPNDGSSGSSNSGASRRHLLSNDPPGLGNFKPPSIPIPGMHTPFVEPQSEENPGVSGQESLNELVDFVRDARAEWQDRAKAIVKLQQSGFNTERIYESTYVSYDKQTALVIAGQVYQTLVDEKTSDNVLSQLTESTVSHLYNLRTLSARQRKSAVEYFLEKDLNVEEVQELAKAIKDHERRPQGREGFTTAPGDCLAFMFHRLASEAKVKASRDKALEQGFSVVVSDSARKRLAELSSN